MGGCSAPNCSNSTTIGKQLFRFPKDPIRMRKWLINCRREFVPTPCSRLCQASGTMSGRKCFPVERGKKQVDGAARQLVRHIGKVQIST